MESDKKQLEQERGQLELAALIDRLTPHDGTHETAIAPLKLYRSSTPLKAIHGVYKPSLCLIARGSKQVMLGENVYLYDPSHFLLVAVDLPVISQVAEATPEEPYLSVSLDIDPRQISALVTELKPIRSAYTAECRARHWGRLLGLRCCATRSFACCACWKVRSTFPCWPR